MRLTPWPRIAGFGSAALLLASATFAQPEPEPPEPKPLEDPPVDETPEPEVPPQAAPPPTPPVSAAVEPSAGAPTALAPAPRPSRGPAASVGSTAAAPSPPPPPTEVFEPSTKVGGYAEATFESEDDKNSAFKSVRFVVSLISEISERVSAEAEIEFERGGSPEKRGGELVAGEALIEYAVLDFRLADWLVARGGVLLVPFGRLNQNHDAPLQELAERPLSTVYMVPSTWFEAGAGFHGDIDLGGTHNVSYQVYLINGLDAKLTDEFGTRAARGSLSEDNNNDKAIVSQVRYSPIPQLDIGLSGYTGDYDLNDNRVWMVGGDVFAKLGRFEALFEYTKLFADAGFVDGFPEGSAANTRTAVPTGMEGYYGELRYRIPLVSLMPRDMRSASMAVAARYSQIDTNEDVLSAGDRSDLTFGLNFRPTLAAVFKAELHLVRNGSQGDDPQIHRDYFDRTPTKRWVGSIAYAF